MKMKNVTLGVLAISSILSATDFNEIKKELANSSQIKKIALIQELSIMKEEESTVILLEELFSDDKRIELSTIRALKNKGKDTVPLIIKGILSNYNNNVNKFKLLSVLEKIDYKTFQLAENATLEELNVLSNKNNNISNNNVTVKENKQIVKTVGFNSKENIPSTFKGIDFTEDFYFEELQNEGINKKEKEKIVKSFIELKEDKAIDKNIKFLSKYGNLIDEYLIEVLRTKLDYLKENTFKIIQANNLETDILNKITDLIELNNNYLIVLLEYPNLNKYEDILFKIYKSSSTKVKYYISEISKYRNLNKINSYVEAEKLFAIQKAEKEEKRIKDELNKFELEKKKEDERVQNELIRISKIEEEEKRRREIAKLDEDESKRKKYIEEKIDSINKTFPFEELVLIGLEIPEIQYNSVLKAGELELIDSIPLIEDLLKDEKQNIELRKQCIFALAKIQHIKIVPIIEKYTNSDNRDLSFVAKKALITLKLKKLKNN